MGEAEEPDGETQEVENDMQEDGDNDDGEEEEDDTQNNVQHDASTRDERVRQYKTPERNMPPSLLSPTASDTNSLPKVRADMVTANMYDIAPTIAAPHSTSINAVTATQDMRWVFSGGADGWIRKFNWVDTVNAKSMLTVAQRHPFVDSVTKAGVLMSYWENEEPSDNKATGPQDPEEALPLSSVYSLAVHPHALWLLSGTEIGAINLQSVRHQEGKRITSLIKHSSAVSVMSLLQDSVTLLSGSWDKSILEWDLNVGQTKRSFISSKSQISTLEMRPLSSMPIPSDTLEPLIPNGMATDSANEPKPTASETLPEAVNVDQNQNGVEGESGSPMGSLFGDNNSLFGDDAGGGGIGFEENDEFSRAIANGIPSQDDVTQDASAPSLAADGANTQPLPTSGQESVVPETQDLGPDSFLTDDSNAPMTNGLPHAEDVARAPDASLNPSADLEPKSESTFLDAAIDGYMRVWDRRVPNPIAKITPPRAVPPWCMHACWSPDGNWIYAGRRNGTVDEYSVHAGLREPVRSLKFPGGSGAVTALRAMPNKKHLIAASYDILRLYDLNDTEFTKHKTVPFTIVPGHRTGVVSQLWIDPTCSFMISTGGNRGWEGASTEVLLGYEVGIGR